MKCPNCTTTLPPQLRATTRPVFFEFVMVLASDGCLRRSTEITAVEKFDLETVAKGTHFTTCPGCKAEIDLSTIELMPVCSNCRKEHSKLTVENNNCRYDGLLCLKCAKARSTTICATCPHASKCKLYKRVIADKGDE